MKAWQIVLLVLGLPLLLAGVVFAAVRMRKAKPADVGAAQQQLSPTPEPTPAPVAEVVQQAKKVDVAGAINTGLGLVKTALPLVQSLAQSGGTA